MLRAKRLIDTYIALASHAESRSVRLSLCRQRRRSQPIDWLPRQYYSPSQLNSYAQNLLNFLYPLPNHGPPDAASNNFLGTYAVPINRAHVRTLLTKVSNFGSWSTSKASEEECLVSAVVQFREDDRTTQVYTEVVQLVFRDSVTEGVSGIEDGSNIADTSKLGRIQPLADLNLLDRVEGLE